MLKHLVTQTLLQKKYPFVIPHDCSKCVQWTGKSEIYADNSAQNKNYTYQRFVRRIISR